MKCTSTLQDILNIRSQNEKLKQELAQHYEKDALFVEKISELRALNEKLSFDLMDADANNHALWSANDELSLLLQEKNQELDAHVASDRAFVDEISDLKSMLMILRNAKDPQQTDRINDLAFTLNQYMDMSNDRVTEIVNSQTAVGRRINEMDRFRITMLATLESIELTLKDLEESMDFKVCVKELIKFREEVAISLADLDERIQHTEDN